MINKMILKQLHTLTQSRFLAAALFLVMVSSRASAQTATITDGIAPTNTITLSPGDTFSVSVTLTTGVDTTGVTYFLEAPGAGSGFFRITARDTTGTPFPDLNTPSNTTVLGAASSLLDPRNDSDLGGSSDSPIGPGVYSVGSFSLQALPSIQPGTYTLQLSPNSVVSTPEFETIPVTSSQYTIVIPVPEPSSLALVAVFGSLAMGARRRRSA